MEIRDVHALLGRTAYDADGDPLGTVAGAYLEHGTGRPSWITVERGGLFRGSRRTFVPLEGAERADDGLRLAVDGDAVRRAPQIADDKVLTRQQESELRTHYGLARQEETAPEEQGETEPTEPPRGPAPSEPRPDPDGATEVVTRSEEQPRVGTTTVATTRAVLRTTRVVEERTFSVPLGRDQAQVTYEPLPAQGPAPVMALSSTQAGERPGAPSTGAHTRAPSEAPTGAPSDDRSESDGDDGWVTLYEERLVVRTEWVPVERVRLRTVGVQGQEAVQVDLRRERVDVETTSAGEDGPPRPAADDRS